MRILSLLALLSLFGLAACDTTLDADDYGRSCSVANDCAAVVVGDVCSCSCNYAAISVSETTAYEVDREDALNHCSGDAPDCAPCPDVQVFCNANQRCELVQE